MTVLAIDVGGSSIKLGLVDHGKVLHLNSLPAAPELGLAIHLPKLANLIREACAEQGLEPGDCDGIGMSFPALVNSRTNQVVSAPSDKYTDATEVDLPGWARETFNLPFKLEIDGHAALLGEWFYGAGVGSNDLVLVMLGTGYGSSVVMRGRPLRGKHFQAGALGGHITVHAGGRQCVCPGKGCIEAETGSWVLPEIILEDPDYGESRLAQQSTLDYRTLFQLAGEGDRLAVKLRDRSLHLWGASVCNLIHAYDPERVILGGGIMKSGKIIFPAIREYVRQNMWTSWGYPEIVQAKHPNTAGLHGVAVLFEETIEVL